MAKRARLTARRRSPETRSGGPADQWPHRRGFTPAPSGLPIAFQLRDILSFRRRGADLDLRGHPRSELGGKLGTLEGYAFLWEAYLREYNPHVIAVARPHEVALVGERVLLDGSRSYSESRIARFEWTFSDGRKASGQTVERTYSQAGTYSEILKITDDRGHTDYDFETVNVLDPQRPEQPPPTIQAAYWPATSIAPGTSVTFTFGATDGEELGPLGMAPPRGPNQMAM